MKNLAFAVIILLSPSLSAQSPLVTDRPNQSDAPFTLRPAVFQAESGLAYDNNGIGISTGGSENLYTWTTIWRVGLVERLELRIITQPALLKVNNGREVSLSRAGMADLQAGLKYNFYRNDDATSALALISQVILPTGSEGFSSDETGFIAKLAGSHMLSDRHSINYNAGYEYPGFGNGDFIYTLYWGIALQDRLSLLIEHFGRYQNFDDWQLSADAGLTYLLSNDLQLDYIFGAGLNHDMNYHTLGLSIRLDGASN